MACFWMSVGSTNFCFSSVSRRAGARPKDLNDIWLNSGAKVVEMEVWMIQK
jgi:hypothetical protein